MKTEWMPRLAVAVTMLLAASSGAWAVCTPDRAHLRGDWGSARFHVEIADDPQERATGLMHRESLGRFEGMLFIYERPQAVSFWMENTLIPLDMIFLDASGTVQRIHENAVPLDRTPIPGGPDILAVLEVNGGLTEDMGITVGSVLRHPDMPQDSAAWSCDAE